MQPLSRTVVGQFAAEFAAGRNGFGKDELVPYFRQYELNCAMPDDSAPWTKPELFWECVSKLTPTKQRMALLDLCNEPPPAKNPMPDPATREKLKPLLYHVNSSLPVGLSVGSVTLRKTREAWWKACSRLPGQPDAALTSARLLLETVCREVLHDWGQQADASCSLGKLVKQALKTIGFPEPSTLDEEAKQVLSGLNSIVGGVSALRNASGDSHALVASRVVAEEHLAELAVNACGIVAVFLVERHIIAVTA